MTLSGLNFDKSYNSDINNISILYLSHRLIYDLSPLIFYHIHLNCSTCVAGERVVVDVVVTEEAEDPLPRPVTVHGILLDILTIDIL